MAANRQSIMAVVVLLLLPASWVQAQTEVNLFKLESIAAVNNGPPQKTIFNLDRPALITKILTYHWNGGRGATPGRLGLRNVSTGQMVGTWDAIGTYHGFNTTPGSPWPAQGDGPPYLFWGVQPNVNVPAGAYEVVDSDHDTWSYNTEMRNRGFTSVFGMYGGGGPGQIGPSPAATPQVKPIPGNVPAADVSGTWSSNDGSMGTLTVSQSGSDLSIRYRHSNGRVSGQLQGNEFEGYWAQDLSGRFCSKKQLGSNFWGRMVLTFNGDSYTGKWGYCDEAPDTAFQGNRTGGGQPQVVPSPGATPEVRPQIGKAIDWGTQASPQRGKNGERFNYICPPGGTVSNRLWGTELYTDDSSICTAAVHAGLATLERGGTVTIEIRPGAGSYQGTARNGVSSRDYGAWDGSFVFVR